LKNTVIKPTEVVEIPELEIQGFWRRIFDKLSHIHRFYWLIMLLALLILVLPNIPVSFWQRIWTSLKAQRVIVSLLAIFGFLAVSLIWGVGQTIDVWLFMLLNARGRRSAWMDWLMLAVTQLGNFIFAIILTMIIFLAGDRTVAYELVLGTMILGLIVTSMKILIHRTRPFIKLQNIRIIGSRASGQSFPSGHTSQAFFLATLLSHYYGLGVYTLVFYLIAGLVGLTRIYVGMHYPRDVLGGAMVGTVWGLVGVIINSRLF
jgi:membrane-associated phospholipid phosphatase